MYEEFQRYADEMKNQVVQSIADHKVGQTVRDAVAKMRPSKPTVLRCGSRGDGGTGVEDRLRVEGVLFRELERQSTNNPCLHSFVFESQFKFLHLRDACELSMANGVTSITCQKGGTVCVTEACAFVDAH